jgi:hypothetical protein
MDLGDAIDTVTDTIEDVLMRLYMCMSAASALACGWRR